VNSFSFQMLVSAAWPADQDSASVITYNATTDSEPDLHGKPQWKAPFAQDVGLTTLGSDSWSAGNGITLSAPAGSSIFFARTDSLDMANWNSGMQVKLRVLNGSSDSIQAIMGFVSSNGSDKQVFVGLWPDSVAFVQLDNVTGVWSAISSTTKSIPGGTHLVTLSVLGGGGAGIAFYCVDHGFQQFLTYTALQAPSPTFLTSHPSSAVFGTVGTASQSGSVIFNSILYQLESSTITC